MPERPIYFTKPDQPEETHLSVKSIGCMSLGSAAVFGVFMGGASSLVWGQEAGLKIGAEFGLAIGGAMGGIFLGMHSTEKAEEFALQGRKKRAYVEALLGGFEAAIGVAITGGIIGDNIAGLGGTIVGGGIGVLVGMGCSQLAFLNINRILNNPEETTSS